MEIKGMIKLTAKIYLSENSYIEVNEKNIISIRSSIFDRNDLKLPSYGIISNNGEIAFTDADGAISDYAENLQLVSGLRCVVELKNTLIENAISTICVFETDEWSYDNNNRTVNVKIKDDLEKLQDINVSAINYDPRVVVAKNFKWIYEYLHNITTVANNFNMQSFEELDEKTKDILSNTYMEYPQLEEDTLWAQWDKLCQVCQLHIYKNDNGVIVCRYNGGN